REGHQARHLRLRDKAGYGSSERDLGEPGGPRLAVRPAHPSSRKTSRGSRRERSIPMPYDLLIKGGNVLDPGQGLDAKMDIAVTARRISAIEPDIPVERTGRVVQIRGENRYVTPGLIDIHTHVAYGATTPGVGMGCCDPDQVGVR